MKAYIITIIGATLLGAVGSCMTPEAMRKYVNVITGFIVISVIVSPLSGLGNIDFFESLREPQKTHTDFDKEYAQAVSLALKKQIEGDAKRRIKEEFSKECEVEVALRVEDGDIKEIRQIFVRGIGASEKVSRRLMEVYNVREVNMDGQKFYSGISQKQE